MSCALVIRRLRWALLLCLVFQTSAHARPKERALAALKLATHPRRPLASEPGDVVGLDDATIDAAAQKLGLPVYDVSPFFTAHDLALPLIENQLRWLLHKHEAQRPRYVLYRRDMGAYEDALVALGTGTDLVERVTSVNLSTHIVGGQSAATWAKYLKQKGVSPKDLRDEANHFVFLDSGFKGSLFDNLVIRRARVRFSQLGERFTGYLVFRLPPTDHGQVGWAKRIRNTRLFDEMNGRYGHTFHEGYGSIGKKPQQRTSLALAHHLQIMPKHTQCGGELVTIRGRVHIVPNAYERNSGLRSIDPIQWINESVVDPVAALKLQARTVNYFSQPAVRDRVLPTRLAKQQRTR